MEDNMILEEKYDKLMNYLDDCKRFVKCFLQISETWVGKDVTETTDDWEVIVKSYERLYDYEKFLRKVIETKKCNSTLIRNICNNAKNIELFFRTLCNRYANIRITSFISDDISVQVHNDGSLLISNEPKRLGTVIESLFDVFRDMQEAYTEGDFFSVDSISQGITSTGLCFALVGYSMALDAFYKYYDLLINRIIDEFGWGYENYIPLYDLAEKYPIDFDEDSYNTELKFE